jgi:16S rRNA processing protein RimM
MFAFRQQTNHNQEKHLRNDYLRVGQIVRVHGVHGDVKIIPLTDDPARFRQLKTAYLETTAGAYAPVAVTTVRFLPDAVLLHLEGYDTVERAETLKNVYLCVSRDNAVRLRKDTYFIVDLIGCETFDTNGKAYGKLTDVLETGAHDVYEIDGGKLLVPALKKLLREVDVENGRIVLDADVLEEVGCFAD